MSSFVESTQEGLSLVIDNEGSRIPLQDEMRINFPDLGGAAVCVEHRNGQLTCSARTPESKEPLLWKFDTSGTKVRRTLSPVPIQQGSTLQSSIEECRISLNGKW